MKKRLFTSTLLALTAMFILPSSVWGDITYGKVKNWSFTWSDATKNALQDAGYWLRENSNSVNYFWYQVPMVTASPLKYGETDLASGLTFLTTSNVSNRIGVTSGALALRRKSSETVQMILPSLAEGNLIEITSTSTASRYMEVVGAAESTINTNVSPTTTSSEQTYSYKIVQGGTYNLQVATTNSSGTDLVLISSITIYNDENKTNTLFQWNTWLTSDQVTEMTNKFNKWVYTSAGYYPYSTMGTAQSLSIGGSPISELEGLTFLNSTKENLRIGGDKGNNILLKDGAVINIPVTYNNSKVSIATSAGSVADNAGSKTSVSGSSPYVFDNVSSGSFAIKHGGSDTKVTSITVEAPYGVISGSFTNGNVTWASEGDVVTEVTNAFFAGSTVTLSVNPDNGYQLKENSLKATYNDGSEHELAISENSFTMPDYNVTVTAEFESTSPSNIQYTITNNTGALGTVTWKVGEETEPSSSSSIDKNSKVTFTATPNEGYAFDKWSIKKGSESATSPTDNPYVISSLDGNYTISATFKPAKYDTTGEVVINEAKSWTFSNEETTPSTCAEGTTKTNTDGLYNRSATSGRGFTFVAESANIPNYIQGGADIAITHIASSSSKYDNNYMAITSAGKAGNFCTPFFAFNTSVPGTCYAYVKNADGGTTRLIFTDGSSAANVASTSTSGEWISK